MIAIADYNPEWPSQFESLRQVIAAKLGPLALTVEHVGSTSVIGLPAKPIIDMDVVVADEESLRHAISLLAELGYEHQGDLGIAGRHAFKRTGPDTPYHSAPEHHLYACTQYSRELPRHRQFRDALRSDPDLAASYAQLKRRLAVQHANDRAAYSDAKSEFVESALAKLPHPP